MYFLDAHSDLLTHAADLREKGLRENIRREHLSGLIKGHIRGVLSVLWISPEYAHRPKERFEELLPLIEAELAESGLNLVRTGAELQAAEKEDQPFLILGIEGASGFPDGPATLTRLYQLGYRHLGLTWNEANEFATGVGGPPERGLTPSGRQALALAEELGFLLDVSHLNEKSFWEFLEAAQKPFVASHSNARSLCPADRNLTDQQVRAIAGRGGVIGLNAWGDFIRADRKPTLDDLAAHADHLVNLAGIEGVGCGFDFCGFFGRDPTAAHSENQVPVIDDFQAAQDAPRLIQALEKRGYTAEAIEKITYKNMRGIIMETI